MPRASTVAHKMYLTAFWGLIAVGVFSVAGVGVSLAHDAVVIPRQLACVDARLAEMTGDAQASQWRPKSFRPDVATRVRLDELKSAAKARTLEIERACGAYFSEYSGEWHPSGWADGSMRKQPALWLALSFFGFIPLAALVAANRWIRWLAKPEATAAPGD